MEIKKVEGFVIDERSFGESSKIIYIITKDYGIIGVLSKGSKRLKSNLRGASQRFSYGLFQISYKENKLSTLVSADIINPLNNIKKDINKISYINYISELTKQVVKQSYSNKIYKLFIDSILKINEGFDQMVITNILEIKYLEFLGVSLDLDGCIICNNKNVVTLSSYKGGFVCKNHLDNEFIVNEKTIKIIRMLKYVDISKISKLDISNEVKHEINDFLDDYYDRYTGLYLKSKEFLKKLVNL